MFIRKRKKVVKKVSYYIKSVRYFYLSRFYEFYIVFNIMNFLSSFISLIDFILCFILFYIETDFILFSLNQYIVYCLIFCFMYRFYIVLHEYISNCIIYKLNL